jgi:sulfite reductase alpha subunit-like flavoprotein
MYILFGSQKGNAEEIAENIYNLFKKKGYECVISSLNHSIENDSFTFLNKKNSKIIMICSTTGNGDAPENANYFWRKLKNQKNPKNLLEETEYAVLGLGDTNYDKFCQMGKNLDRRFNELGSKRVIELHCADDAVGQEETVNIFIEKVIRYFTDTPLEML